MLRIRHYIGLGFSIAFSISPLRAAASFCVACHEDEGLRWQDPNVRMTIAETLQFEDEKKQIIRRRLVLSRKPK